MSRPGGSSFTLDMASGNSRITSKCPLINTLSLAVTPDFDREIMKSALETDPWVTYAKKEYSYKEVLERVRWLSENATLLKVKSLEI